MPFIEELAAGTLPQETFKHYIVQDLLYLREYSKVLALLAAKADMASTSHELLLRALGVFQCELALHGGFLQKYGLNSETVSKFNG